MHLRPPSIDPGVTSFIWALVLGLFVWVGLLAIGISQATALVVGLLSFGAIFLIVRLRGGDDPLRSLDRHARGAPARKCDDQQAREVSPECRFETLEGRRAGRGDSEGGAVLEQELVAPLALRKRGVLHGPPSIGGGPPPEDP